MKRFLMVVAVIMMAMTGYAQDRKAERRARREQRRIEAMARDSVKMAMGSSDSVNIGYGYVKRRTLTTSVSRVKINEDQLGGYSDIGAYLQGRVPGLQVRKMGNTYKFTIRGINSINSPTDPLLIVDGVEVNDISFLHPRDVKSVEVLKDASASIYGARGACGVILITTKQ